MSWKSEWKKVEAWWKGLWEKAGAATGLAPTGGTWPATSLASCWEGKNAEKRHMNTLSPKFTDEEAERRFRWASERGCNTVHLFVCNQGDGEGSGYSIYGGAPVLGKVDKEAAARMERRLRTARKLGLSVALWLMADDSAKWNRTLLGNPRQYAADLKASGLLGLACCVVLGLEMDEYMSAAQAQALAAAVREVWSGKTGTHHTSGKGTFAGLGDVLFWQTKTGLSAQEAKAQTAQAARFGRPVVMFEMARQPARGLCEAALEAGAAGVGNW